MSDKPGGQFARCPWCKKYTTICANDTGDLCHGNGYSIASCSNTSCHGTVLLCKKCPQFYRNTAGSGTPRRRVIEHIQLCHTLGDDDASLDDNGDDCPPLSVKERHNSDDERYDDDESIAINNEHDEVGVDIEDEDYYDCNDFDNNM